jgi:hypothetical protein
MSQIKFALLLSVVLLTLGVHEVLASAGTTYAAGNCKPGLPSYPTIQGALNATPPPTVVLVCPGNYPEQVQITQPVTLQGISQGNSAQAIISASGGLTQTTTDDLGNTIYYQVWVNNVSGPVNISDITIDGAGNGVSNCVPTYVVAIFYQNSPGTVNRITARNQTAFTCGIGVELEGGSANPSVTVENSSIHGFDDLGIYAETNSVSSELTATINANDVNGVPTSLGGIYFYQGITATVTGNFVSGSGAGIAACCGGGGGGGSGSISGNTVTNVFYGVQAAADELSVTSNKIFNVQSSGVFLNSPLATVKGNSISNSPTGIEFNCYPNNNVHSNTINDATTGVDSVPAGVATSNGYYNVATVRTGC